MHTRITLAPGAEFIEQLACNCIRRFQASGMDADFSEAAIMVPNLKMVPELSRAFFAAAGGPVLLPRINTFSGMVEAWLGEHCPQSESRRELLLYALLKQQNWLDESILWDVVGELTDVFDTLTEHSINLPHDDTDLVSQLEQAMDLRNSEALNFEARVTCLLWRAEAQGAPSLTTARKLASSAWLKAFRGPLVIVHESVSAGPLEKFAESASFGREVFSIHQDRGLSADPIAPLLECVMPQVSPSLPLLDRVGLLSREHVADLTQRITLRDQDSLEALAESVRVQVRQWIDAGHQSIALIASDRVAARRARALLERDRILVQDETGWKMNTTRIAATVDAWLELNASDGWHRSVVNLLRSSMVMPELDGLEKGQGIGELESVIIRFRILRGLARLTKACEGREAASRLMARINSAGKVLRREQRSSVSDWLLRLENSLQELGCLDAFRKDAAGKQWLEWLEKRKAELAGDTHSFSFQGWRTWFNRQMDSELFRDESIESPVILTHLAASRMRRFDAAIIIGADSQHFTSTDFPGWLTHQGVRRELGLPGADETCQQREADLCSLILSTRQCAIHWQSSQRDEAILPAAEISQLRDAMNLLFFGQKSADPAPITPFAAPASPNEDPPPALAIGQYPARFSASAVKTLLDCPYRYFGHYVLRLGETEEMLEGMEKRDLGEKIHAILFEFHQSFPVLAGYAREKLVEALKETTEKAFQDVASNNYHDHAWRIRWSAQIEHYIDWQLEREDQGWKWSAGETEAEQALALADGQEVSLRGRLDRVDMRQDKELSVIDYKSRAVKALRTQLKDPDDIQLAFYALISAQTPIESGYLSLDGADPVEMLVLDDPGTAAKTLRTRIVAIAESIGAGTPFKPQGSPRTCSYCELSGLCRRPWK